MDDEVFELVELSSGVIALKRHGDESDNAECLIKIEIGSEIEKNLNVERMEFVRIMLEAGFAEAADHHQAHYEEELPLRHSQVLH
jgi:hypothetical protein